jgi:hypothetical protein
MKDCVDATQDWEMAVTLSQGSIYFFSHNVAVVPTFLQSAVIQGAPDRNRILVEVPFLAGTTITFSILRT